MGNVMNESSLLGLDNKSIYLKSKMLAQYNYEWMSSRKGGGTCCLESRAVRTWLLPIGEDFHYREYLNFSLMELFPTENFASIFMNY